MAAPEDPSPRADCCFTNRAFSGVCRVRPSEDETCATILAYLNNPQSRGKTYCGTTTIRTAGTTVLIVEQNAAMALSVASRGYVLQTGEIVLQDTAERSVATRG